MSTLKDIAGLEGQYAVSREGQVWSYKSNRFLGGGVMGKGYRGVTLPDGPGGKFVSQYVHRLVASTYIPNPLGKEEVNHINGNKADNRVENLEWSTRKENIAHAVRTGLSKVIGEDNPQAKLTTEKVSEIRDRYFNGPETQDELAIAFAVHRVLIKKIVTGAIWKESWRPEYDRPPRWKDSGAFAKRGTYDLATAKAIRARYAIGGCTTRSLASELRLQSSTVWRIVAGKDWTAKIT